MLLMKRFIIPGSILLVFVAALTGVLWAGNISPAQEQEFTDARDALNSARNVQADKYASSYMKLAEDFLNAAQKARQTTDTVMFSRASLLARAYAELAEALAKLEVDAENLAATNDALQKAKAQIEQLKNKP